MYYEDYLEHYGVKGMKWGVVNEDASKNSGRASQQRSKKKTDTNAALNLAGYRSFQSSISSGRRKYTTKTPKEDRKIFYPPGYTTTEEQRAAFYKNFSNQKPNGVTGANGGIPGATIYTYRALADSPAGKEMISRTNSAYDDCAYRAVYVDWDSGVVTEDVVIADDHDINNISRKGGNTKYLNFKNSTALKQQNSAVRAQAMVKKARALISKIARNAMSSVTSSKQYKIGSSLLSKMTR